MQCHLHYAGEQRKIFRKHVTDEEAVKAVELFIGAMPNDGSENIDHKFLHGPTLISCDDFVLIAKVWPQFAEKLGNEFNHAVSGLWHDFLFLNSFDVRA